MKKRIISLLIVSFVLTCTTLYSQNQPVVMKSDTAGMHHHGIMLGLGTGMNSLTGLFGIRIDVPVMRNIYMNFGFGSSLWGSKASGNIVYMPQIRKGWHYGFGFSHYAGVDSTSVKLEVLYDLGKTNKKVIMDQHPCNMLNLFTGYNFPIGTNMVCFTDFGYSLLLTGSTYTITDGNTITVNSKNVMRLLQPGGIIAGIGIAYIFR